jgi:nifR3 family TIM-barrel protein
VKTRLGWDDESKNIVSLAEQLQDAGVAAITIHGRTRAQMYKGSADWTLIGEVKHNPRMSIPIIGNGDVKSPEGAKEMFDCYGVDAIMVGRATYGHPWIFKEINHYLATGSLLPPLTVKERVEIAKLHFAKSLEYKQGKSSIYEMRRHFNSYFKQLPNFKETRLQLLTSENPQEVFELLDAISTKYG